MKKTIRKSTACVLAAVLLTTMLGGCGNGESSKGTDVSQSVATDNIQDFEALPKEYEGTLTMWGWDDIYFKAVTEGFNKIYPNVKFEYTPVANGDLLQKYQTALASGTELPDIGWAIIDSRAKVYELDMWEPLNQAPYNFDIKEVYDYLHPIMVNQKGDICGIDQCLSPAGLAYRKDLAEEYLGTADPQELEDMLPTWEAFIEKGREVQEKSGGKVYMWPGVADAQQFIRGQDSRPWIEGNTIKATETLMKSLELACEFRDNKTVDNLEAWSPAWYASFGGDTHIFAGCATWSVPFTIEPNDPAGENTGHWGLMSAPEGNISWGGTTLGITKSCKDKALAWEFIQYATLSTEGAKALSSIGFMSAAKAPYEEEPELKSFKSKWFGEQDLGNVFLEEIVPDIQIRTMNIDDNIIHDALNLVTTSINNDTNMTAVDALELLKEELAMKLPDYTIE